MAVSAPHHDVMNNVEAVRETLHDALKRDERT